MISPEVEGAIDALLEGLLARHRGRQMFVFGPAGEPFWAARLPLKQHEVGHLERALELIEKIEAERAKPFFAHDMAQRLIVGAVDLAEDLYFVILEDSLDPAGVEARVTAVRLDLAASAELFRKDIRLRAAALN